MPILAALTFAGAKAQTSSSDAVSLGLTELTDDLSRQQLFSEISSADQRGTPEDNARATEAGETFALTGPFRFPGDTTYDSSLNRPRTNAFFGVDISHYTSSSFPIEQLARRNILFVYMKATQGATGLDGKFASFWQRAGALPKGGQVHRGAYHFLSACQGTNCSVGAATWGKLQAGTFVKVVRANGGLLATDMPPVVDLEWDKATKDGPDRWQNRSADEIEAMVDAFVTEVKTELGRAPMIYTARSWWDGRITRSPKSTIIRSTPLWLADYSKSSRASEVPRTIAGLPWVLWQFTEASTMATGFNAPFDANVWKGSRDAFHRAFGVQDFAR